MNLKKRSIFLAIVFLPACVFAGTYSGGTGEPNNPYLIATAEDLNDIGNHIEDFNKCFLMVADINLADYTGTKFNLIGTFIRYGDPNNKPFLGVFDGNSYTISNFTYTIADTENIAMFTHLSSGGQIKNLRLENVDVNAQSSNIVGSLVARNSGGIINNCFSAGVISGDRAVGGLVGFNDGVISNSYSAVTTSGDRCIGGLVGTNIYGTILNCSVKGSVNSAHSGAGGLVGWNDYIILNSYAECIVSGGSGIGGLVGMHCSGTISNCYSTGITEGDSAIGGLIGEGDWGAVFNCYATAIVIGSTDLGALIGYGLDTFFSDCFWDKDLNPSIGGAGDIVDPNGTIAETTENMKKRSTFTDASWDFIDIWDIGENQTYPFLRTHPAGDIDHDDIVNFLDFAILADHWLEGAQ